jgi:hypothetical protein
MLTPDPPDVNRPVGSPAIAPIPPPHFLSGTKPAKNEWTPTSPSPYKTRESFVPELDTS